MIRRITSLTAAVVFVCSVSAFLLHRPATQPPLEPDPVPGAIGTAATQTDFSDYIWPTDAGRKITSSFAEFRRTHFHGGLDIGTGSTTGYKVFAMRDGYVSRIRVSPTGYGKMLFVRHADGFSTTYAHLSSFNAPLNERVAREQQRFGRFAVEVDCAPGEYPVRKGELIAHTGETGVGTPHLHFELRDPYGDFVNPMLCDSINVFDTVPPTVRRIAVRPLGEESRVDGEWSPRVYGVRRGRNGSLTIDGTIRVTGRAGVAVDARDISNGSRFRHGVYGYDLYLDDVLVHRHRLDRAPADGSQQIMLYYDWALLAQGRGRFEKLYTDQPHELPFYPADTAVSGIITTSSLTAGPHALRIVVTDFRGNTTEVAGTMVCNHPPSFRIAQTDKEYTLSFSPKEDISRFQVSMKHHGVNTWKVKSLYPDSLARFRGFTLPHPQGAFDLVEVVAENSLGTRSAPRFLSFNNPRGPAAPLRMEYDIEREFVRLVLTTTGDFTAPPVVTVYEGDSKRDVTAIPTAINRCVATFRPLTTFAGTRRVVAQAHINGLPASTNREFDLYPIVAGDSGSVSMDGGNLVLSYQPTTIYRTEFLRFEKEVTKNEITYLLSPEHIVLRGGLTVTARIPARAGSHPALFARGMGSGEDLLAVARKSSDQILSGTMTRTIGNILIAEDATPPSVSRLHIARAQSGRPAITFRYGDNLSGVDYQEFKMYIDGQIAVPEIDGEHRRAFHHVTAPLSRGSHHLLIRIKDRLGNTSEVERRFTVR